MLKKESLWKSHKKEFLLDFLGILIGSLVLLFVFNLVPAELEFSPFSKVQSVTNTVSPKQEAVLPVHITIPKIGVDVSISNPESDNVSVLDEYLKSGAVHYPGSGSLVEGNMFLFAHSTGFKIVHNQAYKAFNNLKDLVEGDVVNVSGEDGKTYVYKVTSVKLASDKDVLVRFDSTSRMLTLSTCNTFGQKEERYVIEASFKEMKNNLLTN